MCVNDSQPMMRYLQKSQPEISGSLGERGGRDMMSRSGGLKPRAVAGKPSVTRLTHSNWTGIRASGIPKAAVRKILRDREREKNNDSYSWYAEEEQNFTVVKVCLHLSVLIQTVIL